MTSLTGIHSHKSKHRLVNTQPKLNVKSTKANQMTQQFAFCCFISKWRKSLGFYDWPNKSAYTIEHNTNKCFVNRSQNTNSIHLYNDRVFGGKRCIAKNAFDICRGCCLCLRVCLKLNFLNGRNIIYSSKCSQSE